MLLLPSSSWLSLPWFGTLFALHHDFSVRAVAAISNDGTVALLQ